MNKTLARILSCFIFDKQERHKFIAKYRPYTEIYGNKQVVFDENAQEIIKNKLNSNEPCFIGRFGLSELKILLEYIKKGKISQKRLSKIQTIYPIKQETLEKFAQGLFDLTPNIDVLACWSDPDEAKYCKKYCIQDTEYINFDALTSVIYPNPWTSALKGKKVLVIHPFSESIKEQYSKRELLFNNQEILPQFELLTLKPPYITKDNIQNQPYASWFEALEDMKKQIENYDFDIAIIGAGPFGIFLADHCKKLGKKAVHVGGATQLLFGIMGQRWLDYYPEIAAMMNEHWIRPSDSEKPAGYKKVENGCYW